MRALLSVYDKSGLSAFAHGLVELGWELLSTGGTMRALLEAGLPVTSVSDVTGFPEMLDGRVKTLHPAIHGGILARRDDPEHTAQLDRHGLQLIDLVVGNLYPFAATVQDLGATETDAIEQIDIGGPTLIRAAAKNFSGVIVLTDPADYGTTLDGLRGNGVALTQRRALAAKAFAHVSAYDTLVAEYLRQGQQSGEDPFPEEFTLAGRRVRTLRYGENPQQGAAAYRRATAGTTIVGVLDAVQLGGKELSFNNLLDADAAWQAAWISAEPTVAIVKHMIPCGIAARGRLAEAFDAAVAGDPISAFGGIVALNRSLDQETAARIAAGFFEVVIAPAFEPSAQEILRQKPHLRLLQLDTSPQTSLASAWDMRLVTGGFLLQDPDAQVDDADQWKVVTRRQPTAEEWRDLRFAWPVVRMVKSNAIVFVRDSAVVGIGSGQPNRLESVEIAARRAGESALGAAMASDAFFPFPDGVQLAAKAGVTAIVQPGGSIRDKQVIAAADEAGMAMIVTGVRHFRH